MKITVVSQTHAPQKTSGAEFVAEGIANFFAEKHEVTLLTLTSNSQIESFVGPSGYAIVRIPYSNLPLPEAAKLGVSGWRMFAWHLANAFGGIRKNDLTSILRSLSPDVVYAHNSTALEPQLSSVCYFEKIPLVLHLHDYSRLCPRGSMYRRSRNCESQCVACRLLTTRFRSNLAVKAVIAVSDFVKLRYRKHNAFQGAKWHVVKNVDSSCPVDEIRSKNEEFTFGFIGSIAEAKGVGDLVEAFSRLPGKAKLKIAGRGQNEYVEMLNASVRDRNIDWLGFVDREAFFADIDCLIVPSRWHEPYGLVAAEALARGIPVIGSRRGGIIETLAGRDDCILYEPDEKNELVAAMQSMLLLGARGKGVSAPVQGDARSEIEAYYSKIEEIIANCTAKNQQT